MMSLLRSSSISHITIFILWIIKGVCNIVTTTLFYVIIHTQAKVLLIFEKQLFVYKGGITMAAFDRICS